MDTVAPIVVSLVAAFKTFKTVEGPVVTVTSVVIKLSRASSEAGGVMAALNAVMSANPAAMIAIGIAALAGGIAYLHSNQMRQAKNRLHSRKKLTT